MGRVNELRSSGRIRRATRNEKALVGREGERGRKARCARETRYAGKGKRLTFRDKAGEEGGKGGHWRDILGSDGDATTVPIRHLRETDRSNEKVHGYYEGAAMFLFVISLPLSQFRLCYFLDNAMYLEGYFIPRLK